MCTQSKCKGHTHHHSAARHLCADWLRVGRALVIEEWLASEELADTFARVDWWQNVVAATGTALLLGLVMVCFRVQRRSS